MTLRLVLRAVVSIKCWTWNKMLDLNFDQVKNIVLSVYLPWCSPDLNCWPSACYADVITATPQHLVISALSINFISNVRLTRNKMLDLNFNQVKNISLSKTCLDAALACTWDLLRVKQTWLPLRHSTFGLLLRSSNIISNVGLTKNKMLDLNFNQVKKHHFVKN